jgi:signal peptidase I
VRTLRALALSLAAATAAGLLARATLVEVFAIPSGSMVPTLLVGDRVVVWKLAYGLRVPFLEAPLLELGVPRRGDVVVFRHPRAPGKEYVKRVVGLPGDVVEIRESVLVVNGVPQPRAAAGALQYEEQSDRNGRWWTESCARFEEQLARGPVAPPRLSGPEGEAQAWREAARGGVATHGVLRCQKPRHGEQQGPWDRVEPGHLFVLGDNRDRSEDSRGAGGWQVPMANVRGRAVRVLLRRGHPGDGGTWIERLFKPIE